MNNVVENVVEDGLDATTQQSVNVATTGMNDLSPLANDEPSGSDYAAFWSWWNLEAFLDNYFCCWFGWCVFFFWKANWQHNR